MPEPHSPAATRDRAPRIALVAGEASGDQLGAALIHDLRQRYPDAQFAGVGGALMREAGLDAWHDCSELAVMGLVEVLRHLPRLLRLRRTLTRRLLQWQPDVLIGIDAPDFNLGLERRLKRRGVRTVHYVSPSVWAWREKRAARIGRSADRVLCLFPMEPAIYAQHGVDARFVGHPQAARFPLQPDRAAARAALALDPVAPVLAVLPGSRLGEIRRLLPAFLAAARLVAARMPTLRIVIPAANAPCASEIARLLAAAPSAAGAAAPIVIDGRAHAVLIAADVVLIASGTATLEAMLAKRPMVIGYRIAALSHWIVMRLGLLKTRHYGLPNVLAGAEIAPERMQHDCTPAKLAAAVLAWFADPAAVAALQPTYLALHASLRGRDGMHAADAVAELIDRDAASTA